MNNPKWTPNLEQAFMRGFLKAATAMPGTMTPAMPPVGANNAPPPPQSQPLGMGPTPTGAPPPGGLPPAPPQAGQPSLIALMNQLKAQHPQIPGVVVPTFHQQKLMGQPPTKF